jgi:hypothetical protein
MFKAKLFLLGMVMLALVVSSCKAGPAPKPTPQPSPPIRETPKPTPTAAPVATPTAAPAVTPTEEAVQLEKLSAGLEKSSSYRIKWDVSFEGKDSSGNPVKWEIHWLEEYTANPPARRVTLEQPEGTFVLVQIKDKNYIVSEGSCFSSTASEAQSLERISPEFGVSGGTFVGYETVAGVKAKHYTFNEKALGWGGISKAKGDVWVAPEGYALKEVVEAYGKDVFWEKGEGTLKWIWEVLDLNKPFTIEVPKECAQALPEDIPILADASEMVTSEGMIIYKSATPFKEAVKFYKEKMPANGWSPASGSVEMENMAMLNFSKGDRTDSVSISPEGEGVTVMITMGK